MSVPFAHTTRSLARDGAGPALLAYVLAGLALAGWLAWCCLGRVAVVEVSRQARLEVVQAAHAVNVPLADRLAVAPPRLGTTVRAGEVLAELDAGELQLRRQDELRRAAALRQQAGALRQEIAARERAAADDQRAAGAAADAARLRVDEARAGAAFAVERARRLRADHDAGGAARIDVLQAEADAQRLDAGAQALVAEARRAAAEATARTAQQQAQRGALLRQLAALQAETEAAEGLERRLAWELEQHRLRAPIDGQIGEVAPVHPGETLAQGQKLVTVVPAGQLMAVAEFEPAAVMGRLRPGQPAELRLDGFPWTQYGAIATVVTRIAAEPRDNRLRVEFAPVAGWPPGIPVQHGLPGTLEVRLEEVTPAVLVLRAAGRRLGEPS